MSERDFCYWLMGFFELSLRATDSGPVYGAGTAFTDVQRTCIVRHLDLVDEVAPSHFCSWIRGAIDAGAKPEIVYQRLAERFQHVIDKQTPGDQVMLNQTHGGDPTFRC